MQHQVTPQHLGIQFHTLFHKNYMYYRTSNLFHYSSFHFFFFILPHSHENKSILIFENHVTICSSLSMQTLSDPLSAIMEALDLIGLCVDFSLPCLSRQWCVLDFTVRKTGEVLRASVTTIFPGFIGDGSTRFGHSQ